MQNVSTCAMLVLANATAQISLPLFAFYKLLELDSHDSTVRVGPGASRPF